MNSTHTPAHGSPSHGSHSHQERPGHGPAPEGDTDLAELLDLDAALGAPVLAAALDAAFVALGGAPRAVADLGAGTGTGTLALATRFPGARVHSLDASPGMLERLGEAAAAAELAERVETHLVDLDGDWPAVLPSAPDLAWAALSLHHVTDPGRVLDQAFGVLRPGGVLVVTEMTGATTYDPDDLGTGRDGLGERLVGALAAHGYPVTAEWTTSLTAAGFAPVERHETAFTASARTTDGARYLALQLARNRTLLADDLPTADLSTADLPTADLPTADLPTADLSTADLSVDDLAALDTAIAALEAGTSGLAVTSGRAVWVAVRPPDAHRAVAGEREAGR